MFFERKRSGKTWRCRFAVCDSLLSFKPPTDDGRPRQLSQREGAQRKARRARPGPGTHSPSPAASVSAKQLARGLAAEHPTRPRPKGNDITEDRPTLPSGGARPYPAQTKEAARTAYLNPTYRTSDHLNRLLNLEQSLQNEVDPSKHPELDQAQQDLLASQRRELAGLYQDRMKNYKAV